MIYANAEERGHLVAGLRDVADFLQHNLDVPTPRSADLTGFPPSGSTDQQMRTEVERIAAIIGGQIKDDCSGRRLADGAHGRVDAAIRCILGAGACAPASHRDEQE